MFSIRNLTVIALVAVLATVASAGEEEATESPTTSPLLCPSDVSCDCQANEKKDWYVNENGCVLCRCILKSTKSPSPTTTIATTSTKRECLEQPRKCRCKAGSYAVFYTDANGCDVCGCKRGEAPSTTTTTTRRADSTQQQCAPMRNCRCKPGSTVFFFTNAQGCDRCACKKDGTETSTLSTTTRQAEPTKTDPVATTTTTRTSTTQTTKTTKKPCPTARDCDCAPGDYVIWHSDWRTGCRTSCSCLRGRATASPQDPVTETRGSTARATTTKATTTKATTTKTTTSTREATTRPPVTRTTKPAVTTTRPAHCGPARECRCRSNARLVLYRDDQGCERCACKLLTADTTKASTTSPATPAPQCPESFKERTCRCKAEAIAVYRTLENGCRDCSCKLIAEASRAELADAAQREAAATSAGTSVAVPVGITTLVVLSIAAIVMTYRRKKRKNKNAAEARRTSEMLTWDESGFQGAAGVELEDNATDRADELV